MGRSGRQRRKPLPSGTGPAHSAELATSNGAATAGDVIRLAWPEIKASARLFALLVMIFAVMFVTSGPFYLAQRQTASRWLDRLQTLPAAAGQTAGTPAILEGRIAADSPAVLRHFVAYVYETQRGTKGSSSWWTEESAGKSAFAIEPATRRVSLTSGSYRYSPNVEPWLMTAAIFTDPIVRDWDHVDRRDGEALAGEPIAHAIEVWRLASP